MNSLVTRYSKIIIVCISIAQNISFIAAKIATSDKIGFVREVIKIIINIACQSSADSQ